MITIYSKYHFLYIILLFISLFVSLLFEQNMFECF